MDTLSDGTPIWWLACACYVWPMPLGSVGKCGYCGTSATNHVERPAGGRARPLTQEEKATNKT